MKRSVLHYSARVTWITIGAISLIIGFVGIFVPLLPTTPFVIVAAYCFSKGSPQLHDWLLSRPYFGKVVRDWNRYGTIPLSAKLMCLGMLSGSLIYIHFIGQLPLAAKWIATAFILAILAFVLSRPSHRV